MEILFMKIIIKFMLNVMVNKVVLNIRVHVYKFSKGDGDDVKRNKSK